MAKKEKNKGWKIWGVIAIVIAVVMSGAIVVGGFFTNWYREPINQTNTVTINFRNDNKWADAKQITEDEYLEKVDKAFLSEKYIAHSEIVFGEQEELANGGLVMANTSLNFRSTDKYLIEGATIKGYMTHIYSVDTETIEYPNNADKAEIEFNYYFHPQNAIPSYKYMNKLLEKDLSKIKDLDVDTVCLYESVVTDKFIWSSQSIAIGVVELGLFFTDPVTITEIQLHFVDNPNIPTSLNLDFSNNVVSTADEILAGLDSTDDDYFTNILKKADADEKYIHEMKISDNQSTNAAGGIGNGGLVIKGDQTLALIMKPPYFIQSIELTFYPTNGWDSELESFTAFGNTQSITEIELDGPSAEITKPIVTPLEGEEGQISAIDPISVYFRISPVDPNNSQGDGAWIYSNNNVSITVLNIELKVIELK